MTASRPTRRSPGVLPVAHPPFPATQVEVPVFLDVSGRRRRWVALGGVTLAALTAVWLSCLLLGATGFSSLPALRTAHLPGARPHRASAVFVASRSRPHIHHLDPVDH